ncbi:AMP-binding protein, partial [Rhodococcus indonesiensis]|uniref:AMP-binding protein n=1 Tax=Rhodococcus indonesiensis TaxID=3055869 RepID=UPI0025A09275
MVDLLERLVWSSPDKDALGGWAGAYPTEDFRRLTYRQADDATNRTARALQAAGPADGERVLLCCENSVEAVGTMCGIAKAGLVAVPVNPHLAPDVREWVVEHVGTRFTVADGEFGERAHGVFARAGQALLGRGAPARRAGARRRRRELLIRGSNVMSGYLASRSAPPVTFFVVPHRGATVAKFGMTSCPCLSNDPGGGVAEPGGVDGP